MQIIIRVENRSKIKRKLSGMDSFDRVLSHCTVHCNQGVLDSLLSNTCNAANDLTKTHETKQTSNYTCTTNCQISDQYLYNHNAIGQTSKTHETKQQTHMKSGNAKSYEPNQAKPF
eukprot:778471_1